MIIPTLNPGKMEDRASQTRGTSELFFPHWIHFLKKHNTIEIRQIFRILDTYFAWNDQTQ